MTDATIDPALDVTVLALFGPGSPGDAAGLAEDLRAQQGVTAEVLFLDHTDDGALSRQDLGEGVRVLRVETLSEGAALRAGLAAARGGLVALRAPGSRSNPAWLATAVAALQGAPDAGVATSHYFLSRSDGQMAFNIDPSREGENPPPGWDAALVFRRDALARLSEDAFLPVLLDLYAALLAEGAVHHLGDALYSISADRFALDRFDAQWTHHCRLARAEDFEAPEPWLSAVVESRGDRAAARRLLRGLTRQVLPAGTFEIVFVDRGSGALAADLAALDWAVPFRAVDAAGRSAGEALNQGIDHCRGTVLVFLDEALSLFPDTLEHHVRTHRENDPRELAVVGTLEVPALSLRRALPQVLSDGSVERGRPALAAGLQEGAAGLDRRNLSLPRTALDGVGGFGVGLPDAALDLDLGQRLDERGASVFYRENARALRQATPSLDALGEARRERARAFVHLVERHPDLADQVGESADRAALTARLEANRGSLPQVAAAAAALGQMEVAALDPIGEEWRALSSDLVERTAALVRHLDALWRAEGTLAGLEAVGADSLQAIAARHPEQVPGVRSSRYLLVPQGDAEDAWLMAIARFLSGATADTDATLVLLANAGPEGVTVDTLQTACSHLTQRIEPPRRSSWGHVLIVDEQTRERPLYRLLAGSSGWVPANSAFDEEVRAAAALAGVPEVPDTELAGLEPLRATAWPLQTEAPLRLLAWPDWQDPADLDALLDGFARPLLDRGDAALCLRFRAGTDGDAEEALARLDAAYTRHFQEDDHFEVFLFDDGMSAEDAPRIGVMADAVLALPSAQAGPRADFLRGVGVPPVEAPDAVLPALQRFAAERPLPLVPAVTWTL